MFPLSIFLIFLLSFSILPSAYATEYDEIGTHYDRHTITFSPLSPQLDSSSAFEFSETRLQEQNLKNYGLAKKYVLSLNLSSNGFEHIEEACLNELNLLQENNFILTSYTVLTPKAAASYTLYGTYNGVNFYSSYYSSRSGYSEKISTSVKSTLVNWLSGSTSLVLGIVEGNKFSIPFSLLQSAAGSTETITYHEGASASYYCAIEATSLGVFSKTGSNYTLCYSTEKGQARPYIVYHTGSVAEPVITANFKVQNVKAPLYDNKQAHLVSAWAVYKDSSQPVKVTVDSSITWKFE
ncbi:MAG: hypothetical protein KH704_10395 [Clostridiales bacterium]|nr:hypothetical protein [Clostridiales bacterium]